MVKKERNQGWGCGGVVKCEKPAGGGKQRIRGSVITAKYSSLVIPASIVRVVRTLIRHNTCVLHRTQQSRVLRPSHYSC